MYVAFNCFTDYNVSYMTKRADNYVAPVVEVRKLFIESPLMKTSGSGGDEGWGYDDDDDLGGGN